MDQRVKFAASMLVMMGGFSALILLAERSSAMPSKTALFLSIVQPLVHAFGPGGAIGVLLGLGVVASAAFWLWKTPRDESRAASALAGVPGGKAALSGPPSAGAGLRKRSLGSLAGAKETEASAARLPQGDQLLQEIAAAAQAELDRLDALADARANAGPSEPAIAEARSRPIVFAEHLRPKEGSWLSYYGGCPTAPADFAWPMSANDPARPIHFLMQWDCRHLAAEDAAGLLPRDGVLYCFLDLADKHPFGVRFIHILGSTGGWRELEPPASLGPVYGAEQLPYCTWRSEEGRKHLPSLRPRWDFQPVAIDYPPLDPDADPEDAEAQGWFWNDGSAVGEELLKAQARTVGAAGKFEDKPGRPLTRPFPAFPHDWAAVRIVASAAIDGLSRSSIRIKGVLPVADDDKDAKERLIAQWREEAEELLAFGARHDLADAVPQAIADDIWAWCESVAPAIDLGFASTVKASVNSSLGLRSAALGALPAEWIERIAASHALALEYTRDEHPDHSLPDAFKVWEDKKARGELKRVRELHAPTPNHMFGPPSYVQGEVEEHILDHVLLLEMSSTHGIDFHLGEGVLQFLITPEDLRARRFDKVMAISTGY